MNEWNFLFLFSFYVQTFFIENQSFNQAYNVAILQWWIGRLASKRIYARKYIEPLLLGNNVCLIMPSLPVKSLAPKETIYSIMKMMSFYSPLSLYLCGDIYIYICEELNLFSLKIIIIFTTNVLILFCSFVCLWMLWIWKKA